MFSRVRTRLAVVFGVIVFLAILGSSLLIILVSSPENAVSLLLSIVLPLAIISVIAVMAASFSIGRGISTPIQRIVESSRRLITGNTWTPVRVTGKDELADLADAYNGLISSLKHIGSGIYDNEESIAAIINGASDGIMVVDNDRKVVLINESASKIFRTTREKATGRPFIEVSMDHELQGMVNACLVHQEQKATVVQTSPGKKSLGVHTVAMPHNSGCLILLQDISELQKSRTTRRDFLTNISHELRTPISSIKILAETLAGGAIKDEKKAGEYLQKIGVETDRLAQLISEMSEMLKIEGGYTPIKKSGLVPAELLEEAAGRLGLQAAHSGLTLSVDIPDELPLISADQDKLEHVLDNLIQNSIKFTPSGGRITLSARAIPEAVQFSVTDTGIGIPEDDLARVFERFYKVDRARSGSGTGLGLAIAKHIVEAHGGKIWVESVEGKGSTFYFTISF